MSLFEQDHPYETLISQVLKWARPQAHDLTKGKTPEQIESMRKIANAGVSNLNEQAENWPRPAARDIRSGQVSEATLAKNSRPLNEMAENWMRPHGFQAGNGPDGNEFAKSVKNWGTFTSLQPETITDPGQLLQVWTRPECPRLNPEFAEWMLGWPLGLTGFGLSATEWSRWRRRTLSLLCLHVRMVIKGEKL